MFSVGYFSAAYFSGAYFSGATATADTTGGGGTVIHMGPPAGWRELTEKDLRRSAEAAHARRRAARLAWLRDGIRGDAPKPVEAPASREPSTITDSVLAGHDGPLDALARLLAKLEAEREEMTCDARRSVVAKARRSVVTGFGERRSVVKALTPLA